jgi:5'-methylthioadenosine phosphorylase
MAGAEIGVFGGSGFYSFREDVEQVEVETPYGKPSAPFTIGDMGGKSVAFLPRHGLNHELPPHAIPYRANVWAMKELGVRRIIGPNASGALKAELELGEFVVCDQFVDRTSGRGDTFYDGPETTHVSAADPFCPDLRTLLVDTARELGIKARDGGTVVVIHWPRFSTRLRGRGDRPSEGATRKRPPFPTRDRPGVRSRGFSTTARFPHPRFRGERNAGVIVVRRPGV